MRAGDLIDEARDYSPAFKSKYGGEKAPLRRLSRLEQALATAVVKLDPEALATAGSINAAAIATALADDDGVVAVPAYITIIDIKATATAAIGGGDRPVFRVTRTQQYRNGAPFPSVVLSDRALRLTDLRRVAQDLHGWEDFSAIVYDYVPLPAPLVDLDSELTVPDGLGGALVALLAEWMARRTPGSGVNLQDLKDERETLIADFIGSVTQQGLGDTWHVLD